MITFATILLVVVVVVVIYNVSKQKPSGTGTTHSASRPKPAPSPSPRKPSHHGRSKYVICKINGEMLTVEEADRIIADKRPLKTQVRICEPTHKRTLKILEPLKVGDSLKMDYKTWTEGEGDRERNFHSIRFKTQEGEVIGTLNLDERREVAIKFDYIRNCVISSIELNPTPKMVVTIYYR